MAALEFYYPLYPNNLPPTPDNPDGVDPRNWIKVGGLGSLELTGAVTGSLLDGVVDTTLTPISVSQITDFTSSVITQAKTISLNQFALPLTNINLNEKLIINSATPDGFTDSHVATVGFVKQFAPSQEISLVGAVTGDLLNGVINTSLTPISTSQITDFTSSVITKAKTIDLNQFAVPQGNISLNGFKITTSAMPNGLVDSDVATVGYVKQFATIPNVTLTGAVTGQIDAQGVIATSLSAAQNLPSKFLNLVYEDTGIYGDPYFFHNFLPNADPEPILNFVTQAGTSSSQTLRRWGMNFKTGLANSVTNEFELSMYHSLLPGNTLTPLKISYSIADASPIINIAGLLDLGNYNARSTASPISAYHLANKGYVDYTVATYPLNLLVPTGDVDLGVYKISSSTTPVSSNHLTNKNYVDTKPLNSFPVTGTIDVGANAVKSSYTPVANADLVNKLYVDNLVSSNVTLKSVGFNRGDIVQLDNLRIRMASTGEYNVEVATVSGTMAITYTRDLFYAPSTWAVNSAYFTLTTTFSKPITGNNLNSDGSYYRIYITDTTNNRFYRCTMYNASLTNSKIPIILERLI